jgi:hypothetical protein
VCFSGGGAETKLNKLWRPYLIKNRVPTEWGTHTLVEATRHLLWEAFRDPANQRFVLLSESDLPIWNSLTMYRQLMAGERSRVDAWWHPDLSGGRWSPRMEVRWNSFVNLCCACKMSGTSVTSTSCAQFLATDLFYVLLHNVSPELDGELAFAAI